MTIDRLKKILYFPLASYFRFFARIRLKKWHPRIIVITGSSGKTTLLHLIESQLQTKALYSHHANSSYGIPFHILGLERKTLAVYEWIGLFFKAPFYAFKKSPREKLYVVEADCDRPGEGKFLAEFLRPEVTLWVSISKTHSMNFDELVTTGIFKTIEDAIAHEFGYFIEYTSHTVIVNADSPYINSQLSRTKMAIQKIHKKQLLNNYSVSQSTTTFTINHKKCKFSYLLPETAVYGITLCLSLMKYLREPIDDSFSHFTLPPGRSSRFKGIRDTTIIDSTYNANLSSMTTILELFEKLPLTKKWIIAGDMLEQGKSEKEEHEKLAHILSQNCCERIILMGKRVSQYTFPLLNKKKTIPTVAFQTPIEVLQYLQKNIIGGETLLFKGARFLEGVIENLLENKKQVSQLVRREKVWEKRRKQWGL